MLAPSLTAYLEDAAALLESGRVAWGEGDEGLVFPDSP